ncbi:dihydrolipoyl dehydrogenase family protein [Granulicella aggregans]|uniref:dihydrolipoyl dehydrogenase family protein n=1 Tax=Granulicella aggregans TaxID=474949 RepID=UPI0021E08731|nr:FAD-dependent oxidoreductase [Granulicella aggregans]
MPSSSDHFDILVLGSGEGGKYIAWSMANAGKKTAVVERRYIGGSCPNIACLPSKNFVHSAKVAHYASQAAAFGLPVASGPIDMEVVRGRKRAMVEGLIEMHQGRFAQTGAQLILGEGRFTAPKTLHVDCADGMTRILTADTIVLSTGSRATIDPIPGLGEAAPLTHIEMLESGQVPSHLIILGGGYIGLEFAQAMRRLGSAVTVVERNPRVLHREDEDVSALLTTLLEREGVNFLTNANVDSVSGTSGTKVTIYVNHSESQSKNLVMLTGSHLLVAAGRTPNTQDIGLDLLGVDLKPSGHIQVDELLRTSAKNIFAVGDCAGSPHFTHIAFDDYRIVRDQLTQGKYRSTTARQVPFCLFTDPEFARIGLSESDAKRRGISYRLARLPMIGVLRTRTMGETEGFLKALIAPDDTILGFTAVGIGTGELLAPVQLAMSANLPYTALRDLIVTHPTLTEGLVYLFASGLTKP